MFQKKWSSNRDGPFSGVYFLGNMKGNVSEKMVFKRGWSFSEVYFEGNMKGKVSEKVVFRKG